jgi:hypothetical protein
MLMKKEKNQYVLIRFKKKNKIYVINLLLKRSLWSRFTHHLINLLLKRSLWSRFTHHQIDNRLATKGDLLLV